MLRIIEGQVGRVEIRPISIFVIERHENKKITQLSKCFDRKSILFEVGITNKLSFHNFINLVIELTLIVGEAQ